MTTTTHNDPIELTITIKGETENGDESTHKQKFLLYETVTLTADDPIIKKCLQDTLSTTKIVPDKIKIKIKMDIQ